MITINKSRPNKLASDIERLTDYGDWIPDDGRQGVAFCGLTRCIIAEALAYSSLLSVPTIWIADFKSLDGAGYPAEMAYKRCQERYNSKKQYLRRI